MADAAGTASREGLKEAALAGVRWYAAARLIVEVALFGSMIVLAQLITPAQFGVAAIALVVQALGLVLAGEGVGSAIVQRRTVEQEHLSCAALISVLLGAALTIVTFLVAPLLGPVFGDDVPALVRIMSPIFLLSGIGVVPQAILQRRLDFRRTSTIEVVTAVSRVAVSVALAVAGLNAEALVLGSLAGSVVSTALLLLASPSPRPGWHPRAGREIADFGLPAAGASFLLQAFRNVDYAIIGAQLGAAQLGFYWRGYQLGVEYQRKIDGVMTRIALPVYSRSADLADMRAIRARVMRVKAAIILPLLSLLIVVAPVLVPWMLGDAWAPTVLPTQILAGVGMLMCLLAGLGPVLLAAGHAKPVLVYNIVSATAYAAVILVAAGHGLTAVCWSVLGFHLLQLLAGQRLLLTRYVGVPFRQLLFDVGPAAVASASLAVVAATLSSALGGTHAVLYLAGVAVPAGLTYLITLRFAFPPAWRDLALVLSRLVPPRLRRGTDGKPRAAGTVPTG